MIKYFDASWKEIDAANATYAVELEHDADGLVTSSKTYIVNKSTKATISFKGGKGSGFKGHAGRPGMVGGSSSGGINSLEFKKWFGNSKVVDKNRKPLVVYHGTSKDFFEFDINELGKNADHPSATLGFYFARDPELANSFATKNSGKTALEGGKVLPVYLKIENPYYMEATDFAEDLGFWRGMRGVGGRSEDEYWRGVNHYKELRNYLTSRGYDGLVVVGSKGSSYPELNSDNFIVFEPNQIKSATGNVGTYDSNNPDITKQQQTSAIIAFDCSSDKYVADLGEQFPNDKKDFHITLAFIGDVSDTTIEVLKSKLVAFAKTQAPIKGKFNGYALFEDTKDGMPLVLLYDSPQLPYLRQSLREQFGDLIPEQDHGFTPHCTLAYLHKPVELDFKPFDKIFDTISLWVGEEYYDFPLIGTEVLKQGKLTFKGGKGSGFVGHPGGKGGKGNPGGSQSIGSGVFEIDDAKLSTIVESNLDVKPNIKSITVLKSNDFNHTMKSKFGQVISIENIAALNHEGDIYVREGFEDSALHEYIHSAGFMPDGKGIDPTINEGLTQAATIYIGGQAGIIGRSGYDSAVDYVNKYIIPLTGMDRGEFFRGYAKTDNKQQFIASAIWSRYGNKFNSVENWGKNVEHNFNKFVATYGGHDIYLSYLVDELGITKEQELKSEKVKEEVVNGKKIRIIYIIHPTVTKQLPIDETSKQRLVDVRIGIYNSDADALAERLFVGETTLGAWEEGMKRLIRELHTSVAAIYKGGWDQMTWEDWGRLGPVLKEQYKYLHGFAQAIADNRDTISLRAIQARAHMYGDAALQSAGKAITHIAIQEQLPWMPREGTGVGMGKGQGSECRIHCCCAWVMTKMGMEKDFNIVQAVWTLSPAEHCDTCIERKGHTVMLRVYKDIDIPDHIGFYCG